MPHRSSRRVAVAALLGGVAFGCALLGHEVAAEADRYLNVDSDWAFLLVPLRWTAIAFGTTTLVLGLATRRRWSARSVSLASFLRGCLYAALLAFGAGSLSLAVGGVEWPRFATRSVFLSVLLLAVSAWSAALVLVREDPLEPRPGVFRVVDLLLANLVVLLALSELGLGFYARLRPSQVLWDEASAESYVRSRRLKPGTLHEGFPANSQGFYDDEFFHPTDQDFVVALLSDSFGIGIVPYEFNFVRVAERRLVTELARPGRRVAIDNFSVTGIDPSGYAWLLEHEVAKTDPALVVLVIFVGNDITGFEQHRTLYWGLQYLRIYQATSRLLALEREVAAGGHIREVGHSQGVAHPSPPALEDEVPTLSEQAFLGLELERLERCAPARPHTQRKFQGFFEALDFFQRRLGDRLLVVLIPDEYQVNDELYATLMERVSDPGEYERFYPQERIRAFCRERGIELVDLTERLRAVPSPRRVYHLRDSHWNAEGNRIGGEALAETILMRFSDRIPGTVAGTNARQEPESHPAGKSAGGPGARSDQENGA